MIEDGAGPETPEEPTAATDGEVDNDLERKRREREAAGKGSNGSSVADRADALGDDEDVADADGQVEFEFEERGRTVTLSNLVARSVPIEREFKFEGRSVKGQGSLIPYSDPDRLLVVSIRAGKTETDPTYDEDGRISKVTVRQILKARYVLDARTEAARVAMNEVAAAEEAKAAES